MSARRRIAGEKRRGTVEDDAPETGPSAAEPTAPEPTAPEVAAAEPDEPDAPVRDEPGMVRSNRAVAALVALTVLALVFAVASVLVVRAAETAATDRVDLESEAVGAAADALPRVLGYSYESVEQDLSDAEALMTDDFAAEYAELAPQVQSLAEQRKLVVTSDVRAIAPLSCGQECSAEEVRVLAFVDQLRTLDGEPGSPAALAAVVRMQKVDGAWLIAELTTS